MPFLFRGDYRPTALGACPHFKANVDKQIPSNEAARSCAMAGHPEETSKELAASGRNLISKVMLVVSCLAFVGVVVIKERHVWKRQGVTTQTLYNSALDDVPSSGNANDAFGQRVNGNGFDVHAQIKRVGLLGNTSKCDCIRRSSLYSEKCNNTKFLGVFPFLVTSTGRSGTDYVQAEFNHLGLTVGHDGPVFKNMDGAVSWPEAFNEKRILTRAIIDEREVEEVKQCMHMVGNMGGKSYGFTHVFHLIRHPLRTIQSRFNLGNIHPFRRLNRCNTATSTDFKLPFLQRALHETLQHWIYWHSFIEQHAEFSFRLEDLDGKPRVMIIREMLNRVKLKNLNTPLLNATALYKKIENVRVIANKNSAHTHKAKRRLKWRDLSALDRDVTAMAQVQALRYGYEVSDEELLPEVWDDCDKNRLKMQKCFIEYFGGRWKCNLYSEAC